MNITKASDIKSRSITALLYGAPGSGKTTTAGLSGRRILVIDVDHNADVLAGIDGVDIVKISTDLKELLPTLKELESGADKEYDCIVLDNLSELENCMLTCYGKMSKNGVNPELQHYQTVQYKIAEYVRRFRDLHGDLIITAWEDLVDITLPDGTRYSKFKPNLGKKSRDKICGLCNVVGRITNSGQERIIQLEGDNTADAKDQVNHRRSCRPEEFILQEKKVSD